MNIIKWDPFRELEHIRQEMESFVSRAPFRAAWSELSGLEPKVDVVEAQNEVRVIAEIPGLAAKDDLDITILENSVQIKGVINRSDKTEEENYHRQECFHGQFLRTVQLPVDVKGEAATAKYENGLLTITIPKKEPGQGKGYRVPIH